MRELIIQGQRVDLSAKTSITLEYISNVLTGATGRINLSRSYTVQLPKTQRNARILDMPGQPAHSSSQVGRFLGAHYIRNGIDLTGPAKAYLMSTTDEAYEVALVFNTLPGLQALSDSKATLQELPNLPILPWIGSNGTTPDYGLEVDGAFFARYDAGVGDKTYPAIPVATHPAMSALSLIDKILTNAGVPYTISSERVREALSSMCILAAPSHRPSREMDQEAGSQCINVRVGSSEAGAVLTFDVSRAGWDPPVIGSGIPGRVAVAGVERFHVSLRLRADASSAVSSSACVRILGADASELARIDFVQTDAGHYEAVADIELDIATWSSLTLSTRGVPVGTTFTTAASGFVPLEMWRVRPEIDIANDNRFPLAENLPDIGQWDFVKACMVLSGSVPVIQSGTLLIMGYDEAFDTSNAYDWTDRLTETESVAQRLSEWSRENLIKFEEDDSQKLNEDPTAVLRVSDETVTQSRDLYTLPFAATQFSSAIHYAYNDDEELEDVEIVPRIMARQDDRLIFASDLYGKGLISSKYAELQRVIEHPVLLNAAIRLTELDLAMIDMRRPVYLRQYGQYFALIKIQTSDSEVCKVELIRIP